MTDHLFIPRSLIKSVQFISINFQKSGINDFKLHIYAICVKQYDQYIFFCKNVNL